MTELKMKKYTILSVLRNEHPKIVQSALYYTVFQLN